ncbi:hypothetical protein C6P45_001742 [Maudiozyma exigua]|uniref:SRP9 domain-containing protein n=1 Tax=Maudiozyma exigua TaxID=34358 RepID=A0A9P6W1S1_MAUEX|nr:hypothetical protein C6P45_001742 [Kazachstania exigua]
MSAVKPLDSYIKNSARLFEANPSETIFTLTYKPIKENTKKTSVVFATHNSQLDTNYKFITNKSKDVSRLLNAIGPRGVSTIPTKIERQAMRKNKTKKVKKIKKAKIVDTIGISNFIVNAKVKEYKPVETKVNTTTNDNNNSGNSNKKGNKKNKNKKRR